MDETLKQKFKVLLAYQKKDIELRKINSALERDTALAEMNKHKRAFNEAKQAIAECEQSAGGLLEQFAALQKYIDDNEALLAEGYRTEPEFLPAINRLLGTLRAAESIEPVKKPTKKKAAAKPAAAEQAEPVGESKTDE